MKILSFILVFLALRTFSGLSQQPVTLASGDRMRIGNSIEYFVDPSKKLAVNDVTSKPFILGKTEILNFGAVSHNVWLRFSVISRTEREAYVEVAAPLLNEVQLYQVIGSGPPKRLFKGGSTEPFNARHILSDVWLFELHLPVGVPVTYYLKGNTQYTFQIPVTVSAKEAYLEENQLHNLFWGMYMGVMIFAFIYNLFVYLSLRDRTYLYYILYVVGTTIFYLGYQGYAYQFLWPDFPALNRYLPVIIALFNLAILLFTLRFLNITRAQRVQYYTGWILTYTFFGIALVNIAGYLSIAVVLDHFFALLVSLYYIGSGVASLRRGVPSARYFLIGWTVFLALVILYILTLNNAVESNFFTTHCIYIGHMTEVLLLSFALADRINWLKRENEAKQQTIIQHLRANEEIQLQAQRELEEKVRERTAELIENQKKLIESEKMAAFGVMAGRMAHEIQNPLNFVNNLCRISCELADELTSEGSEQERLENMDVLKQNLMVVKEHGERASGIIKQLQQHAHQGTAHRFFDEDAEI